MVTQIVNAAPLVNDYGTQDLSTRQLPREPEAIPQHLPKFYLFTQKGPVTPQLVSGAERNNIFGDVSFNIRGKYFNHATLFSNAVNAEGNAQMIQRLVPDDAGPEANMIVWLDVLPTTVDDYLRNDDGSIRLDGNGDPTIIGTVQGYKAKWVVTHHSTEASLANFGAATQQVGDQVDPATSTQSTRYPIFEFKISSKGEYGNNSGIRIWAPTMSSSSSMPTSLMTNSAAYPYLMSVVRREDALSTPRVVQTLMGEQQLLVTLKEDTIDPLTDRQVFIGDTFINSYQNLDDLRYPAVYGDFGDMHIYLDNLSDLLSDFHAAEIPYIDQFSDFSAANTDKNLFNIISGVSSFNVPYHSFVFVDAPNAFRFSEYSNLYARGGSDGTMNDEIFAELVSADVKRYADANDVLQDIALNVESIIYDSGFPLTTKQDLCNFISLRKDTFVVLGTHTVGERELTAAEEHSIAIALRTRLQMFPESDYFGTPVMRGMIMGRSGRIRNSQYTEPVSTTYEVAVKSARYMGASDGRWRNGSHFDGAPGSIIDTMYDFNINWVPNGVRNRNWDVGLNWVSRYDRRTFFFPALKTVYADDTSVLNSYFTALACGQLNKVAHATWREFSGVSHLTNAQLVQRTNDFVTARTRKRFDDRFVIRPDGHITDMDQLRGFSWTLGIQLWAANMKTVMTTYVQVYRMDDLEGTGAAG
jgi:hypothetical protein